MSAVELTIGCRQYADRLRRGATGSARPPCRRSSSTTALARRHQRVARAAALAAATTGLITEAAGEDEPFGFCHYSPDPATRWAMVLLVLGTPTATTAIRFLEPRHPPVDGATA
jgi:hypothetical protein